MHEGTFTYANHTIAVSFTQSTAAVNNTKMEFSVFDTMGNYLGAVRVRYTNLASTEAVDEWVFNKVGAEIKRRIDAGEDFGMTTEEYTIDSRLLPRL